MSSPSPISIASDSASAGSPGEPLARFVEERRGALEDRLARECRELGAGLGKLGDVLALAVGTEGRGGSRWRPLLTLAATEALRGPVDEALDAAVAVEFTHTASLVLDDLPCMDDSPLRRGQPSTHSLVGSAGAILLSVSLLARAVELLGRHPRCGGAMAEEWGRTVGLRGMAGGQAMDVSASGALRGAERRLHREKSTALPAFALSSGARVAGAEERARAGLESFGRSLGWAYQLLDDAEDVGEDSRQGRPDSGPHRLPLSRRILRRACRQLGTLPDLTAEGAHILEGMARRVVGARPTLCRPSEDATQTRRV